MVCCSDVTVPEPWQVLQVSSPIPPLPSHSSQFSIKSSSKSFSQPKTASSNDNLTFFRISLPLLLLDLLSPRPEKPWKPPPKKLSKISPKSISTPPKSLYDEKPPIP